MSPKSQKSSNSNKHSSLDKFFPWLRWPSVSKSPGPSSIRTNETEKPSGEKNTKKEEMSQSNSLKEQSSASSIRTSKKNDNSTKKDKTSQKDTPKPFYPLLIEENPRTNSRIKDPNFIPKEKNEITLKKKGEVVELHPNHNKNNYKHHRMAINVHRKKNYFWKNNLKIIIFFVFLFVLTTWFCKFLFFKKKIKSKNSNNQSNQKEIGLNFIKR